MVAGERRTQRDRRSERGALQEQGRQGQVCQVGPWPRQVDRCCMCVEPRNFGTRRGADTRDVGLGVGVDWEPRGAGGGGGPLHGTSIPLTCKFISHPPSSFPLTRCGKPTSHPSGFFTNGGMGLVRTMSSSLRVRLVEPFEWDAVVMEMPVTYEEYS